MRDAVLEFDFCCCCRRIFMFSQFYRDTNAFAALLIVDCIHNHSFSQSHDDSAQV